MAGELHGLGRGLALVDVIRTSRGTDVLVRTDCLPAAARRAPVRLPTGKDDPPTAPFQTAQQGGRTLEGRKAFEVCRVEDRVR